jgi:hypothetical protein
MYHNNMKCSETESQSSHVHTKNACAWILRVRWGQLMNEIRNYKHIQLISEIRYFAWCGPLYLSRTDGKTGVAGYEYKESKRMIEEAEGRFKNSTGLWLNKT